MLAASWWRLGGLSDCSDHEVLRDLTSPLGCDFADPWCSSQTNSDCTDRNHLNALSMRIAQLPLALTLAHEDSMKHWLSTIRTNRGFRATLLVAATGGLFGCWSLSQALAEGDQPLITLWASESSLAQTNSRPPVYVAQVTELPSHRLPSINAKPSAYGKPLVVDNPFATQLAQTDVDSEPLLQSEFPAPTIRHLPVPAKIVAPKAAPKAVVPKTIVPVPAARLRRAPMEEVADYLPYALAPLPPNLSDAGSNTGASDIEERNIEEIEADWTLAPTMPNTPTVAEISTQVMPSVQKAYGLARRGALYASRDEFIAILRRICHAKDAELGTNEHARSLARGLRAIEEADDFMPVGAQLEADFDTYSIAKSHHTPVLQHVGRRILPHDAIAQYHAYAAKEIGIAVAGEQAGSMVLYGLGKIQDRIAQSNNQDLQSVRKSMAMYQASLLAHPGNHMAANELGVLLAQSGHYRNALAEFEKVVRLSSGSTAYRNLATVQRKLGQPYAAMANEQHGQRLAHWERSTGAVSRRLGVKWVSAAEMARVSQPSQMPSARPAKANIDAIARQQDSVTPRVATRQHSIYQRPGSKRWPIERLFDAAKSVATPSQGKRLPQSRIAQPQNHPATPLPKNTHWR